MLVLELFRSRVKAIQEYLSQLSSALHQSSLDYWKRFGQAGICEELPHRLNLCRQEVRLYTCFQDGPGAAMALRSRRRTSRTALETTLRVIHV